MIFGFDIALVALAGGLVLGQPGSADAQNGRELAQKLCATCHVVSADQAPARIDVPSFAVIANLPGQTAERLAGAIVIPHPEMPAVSLTRQEIRDVIAYILTLRAEK